MNTCSIAVVQGLTRTHSDDPTLVSCAIAGDGLAYRRLVEPHLSLLYRIAARHTPNRALVEDIVQEVLILAYQKLKWYRPDASFKAFLAGIAVRKAHSMRRSEARRFQREVAHGAPPPNEQTPEQDYQAGVTADLLRQAVQLLPTKQRQALLLRLDAQLEYADIAQALSTSEGAVRVLIHKATQQLQHTLQIAQKEEPYAVARAVGTRPRPAV